MSCFFLSYLITNKKNKFLNPCSIHGLAYHSTTYLYPSTPLNSRQLN